jgi:bifunctional non-homologous end joining protein LigD
VAFTEFTPDGMARHPTYRGLREDKSAAEVRREEPVPLVNQARLAARRQTRPVKRSRPE